jgi:predicted enzyme related to lactoylglutathione lyase
MSDFKNVNVSYVYVRDWEAAKKFYSDTLNWPLVFGDDGVGWFGYGVEGASHFAISRWEDQNTQPARGLGTTIVFSVEDAQATTKALRAKGVRCDDPMVIPGMVTYGTFYDPEGNRLQFASNG